MKKKSGKKLIHCNFRINLNFQDPYLILHLKNDTKNYWKTTVSYWTSKLMISISLVGLCLIHFIKNYIGYNFELYIYLYFFKVKTMWMKSDIKKIHIMVWMHFRIKLETCWCETRDCIKWLYVSQISMLDNLHTCS